MPSKSQIDAGIEYIRTHPEIRDVVLSGGDPLSLSDRKLDRLLGQLREIEHLEIIRLGTRHPVTLPQRITPELCAVLKKHPPLYVHVHFNHPRECTAEARNACSMLAEAGCVLGNQMVLLKGVNDCPETVKILNQRLLEMRVRPYYIFHCDPAQGIRHFKTPISTGIEIIRKLRGWTSGMAVPQYVVDLPGGGGKTVVDVPAAVKLEDGWSLRGYDGREWNVPG